MMQLLPARTARNCSSKLPAGNLVMAHAVAPSFVPPRPLRTPTAVLLLVLVMLATLLLPAGFLLRCILLILLHTFLAAVVLSATTPAVLIDVAMRLFATNMCVFCLLLLLQHMWSCSDVAVVACSCTRAAVVAIVLRQQLQRWLLVALMATAYAVRMLYSVI